ncbi:hypothetical protein BKA69DRAFT_1068723 [Paraphysoderma sedebokerense]|nr:hypothetical protein BKA69DRAFT_1068723 [Paraphysoderma sedebokerense]
MCKKGYYRRNQLCAPCTQDQTILLAIVLLALVIGIFSLYAMINLSDEGSSVALVGIAINFFQTILVIRDFHIQFPPQFHSLMNILSIFNLNIQLTPPECFVTEGTVSYSLKLRIVFAFPLFLILLSLLIPNVVNYIMPYGVVAYIRDKRESLKHSITSNRLVAIRMVNFILPWIFMSSATNSLALFDCTTEADGHLYMDVDPSVKCWIDPTWWQDVPLAVAACILYVFGIPCYFFMLLLGFSQQKETGPMWQKVRNLSREIMQMDQNWKPGCQKFTFIQILQKLSMVLINMFFTKYTSLQVALMIFVLVITFGTYLKFQPYKLQHFNSIEMFSSICSIAILLFGQVYSSPSTPENQKQVITVLILLVIISFVIAVLAVGFIRSLPYIRDLSRSAMTRMGKLKQSEKSTVPQAHIH